MKQLNLNVLRKCLSTLPEFSTAKSGENYPKCISEPAAPSVNFPFISYCFQHKEQTEKAEIHLFWIHTWINDTVVYLNGAVVYV